jgi:S-adenosyl-L-methionine hydrolase (adenosine-forming)
MKTPIIALLTDFGEKDFFVPSLKAVIAGINPEARTIDITHEVPSFDVRAAGFILYSCYSDFPQGTVFLAVVDPGVASGRAILLAQTRKYFFIAPDNGLLTLPLKSDELVSLRRVTQSRYWLADGRSTFEARDRMAPVAAWLTRGLAPQYLGPVVKNYKRLKIDEPRRSGSEILGEILYQDKFGNLMTNIPFSMLGSGAPSITKPGFVLSLGRTRISRFAASYAEVKDARPFFLINSQGLIEVAVREGSAAVALGATPGDPVRVRFEGCAFPARIPAKPKARAGRP